MHTQADWLSFRQMRNKFTQAIRKAMPPCPSNISSSPTPSNATIPDASPSFSPAPLQSFSLQAVTESKELKELLKLDPQKTSVRWFRPFLLQGCCPYHCKACLSFLGRFPLLGRQPQFVLYLKGEIKLILNVIVLFLFFPVYQKCWKTLSIIN